MSDTPGAVDLRWSQEAIPRNSWQAVIGRVQPHHVGRLLGYVLRAGVLALFVQYVWAVHYAPHRTEPFGDSEFEAAVRGLNAGHPFFLQYPATDGSAPVLRKMNEGVLDQGIAIVMTVAAQVHDWLTGTRMTVTAPMGRTTVMLLFGVTAAAIVAPGVPLLVAIAGVLAFYVLMMSGPVVLGLPVHWGVAFAAVVVAVYLGTTFSRWTWPRVLALSLLAALASGAQILRQDAAGVPYGVGCALIVIAAVCAAIGYLVEAANRSALRRVARRAIAGGLLLIAATAAAVPIERWCISREMDTPFFQTPAIQHGSEWPLYLSLGYVSNPFNIAWRDPIGQLHAGLILTSGANTNPSPQSVLLDEFIHIVVSRPWLLLENLAAKAVRIHMLAVRRVERLPDVAVWQLPAHTRAYLALPWLLVGALALLWWRGTPEAAAFLVASLALAAAASASALVVFPDYMGGVQGVTVALALVGPAALASYLIDAPLPAAVVPGRRILAAFAALAAGALLVAGAFVAVQWARYRAVENDTVAREPLAAIEAEQFRYAHVFNDLPVARQGRVIARLTAAKAPNVAAAVDVRRGDLDLFRPIVLVRTASQLHLIAWMGSTFRPPEPPFYQGRTDSLFFLCGECPPEATVNDFPFDSGWAFVSDLEWRGRYRMFSVPLNDKLRAARFFHVAAEQVLALDATVQSTGLRPGLIAGARVSY
jgi:hypothetical protein